MIRILFGIIASLGLLSALGTVLAKNLVHAALFLVAFFFLVACQFVLLEAEFMAAMQVLVYIGAVSIIMMFGIMLTRNIQGDETTGGRWVGKIPAAVVAIALLVVLIKGIGDEKAGGGRQAWSELTTRPPLVLPTPRGPAVDARSAAIVDMPRTVGNEMLQRYIIPFEVAGLLLTAALIGAVALAQAEESEIVPRLGASADQRGGTTEEPNIGLAARGANGSGRAPGAAAPLAGAKLSPGGESKAS